MVIGLAASEGTFDLHPLFQVVLITVLHPSDPHATDMGRVESKPTFVHYSFDTVQPLLGFGSRHRGPIF